MHEVSEKRVKSLMFEPLEKQRIINVPSQEPKELTRKITPKKIKITPKTATRNLYHLKPKMFVPIFAR